MRVLLVSTYELGHQPIHVASPAGALIRGGHEVRCVDLAVERLDPEAVAWAEAVALSVPMHTAMRLALAAAAAIRAARPGLALCFYGLYAVLAEEGLDGLSIAGEYEPELVAWVEGLAGSGVPAATGTRIALGRGAFGLPARHLLPPLDAYARLALAGGERLAGYVEASHGCAHRCRHCPVPVVYDGRTRLVGEEALLADVTQLVELGMEHLSFGDPDFLNGPHHARRVVDAVHGAFPGLSFDVTVKVEHILRHPALWPELAAKGCLFVVSAFESATDAILERLDKGHTVADEIEAVRLLREAGIEPRPSLLPFTPWTGPEDLWALVDLVAGCDLVGNVDPIQYAIRLLVPPRSLLLAAGELEGRLEDYDREHLGWRWRAPDPRVDELQLALAALAERAGAGLWPAEEAYSAVREAVGGAFPGEGGPRPGIIPGLASVLAPDERPRLTEAWFCCAEPMRSQLDPVLAAGDPPLTTTVGVRA